MASERQNMSEQEISIKAREHEVFIPKEEIKPVKPFTVYLRETPAKPCSPLIKTILWIVGIVVGVLFLAALWRLAICQAPALPTETRQTETKTAIDEHPPASPLAVLSGWETSRRSRFSSIVDSRRS